MRGVDGQHVHFAPDQLLGALEEIAGGADRRPHPQPALAVFGRVRVLQLLLDVLDGDEALEGELVVHHQQFFDAVLVQDGLGLLEGGAHRNRHQVLLGHHLGDEQVEAVLEPQVAVGEDADQLAALGDRHARDAEPAHELLRG